MSGNNLGTEYVALFYYYLNDFLNWQTRDNEVQNGKRAHNAKSKLHSPTQSILYKRQVIQKDSKEVPLIP